MVCIRFSRNGECFNMNSSRDKYHYYYYYYNFFFDSQKTGFRDQVALNDDFTENKIKWIYFYSNFVLILFIDRL